MQPQLLFWKVRRNIFWKIEIFTLKTTPKKFDNTKMLPQTCTSRFQNRTTTIATFAVHLIPIIFNTSTVSSTVGKSGWPSSTTTSWTLKRCSKRRTLKKTWRDPSKRDALMSTMTLNSAVTATRSSRVRKKALLLRTFKFSAKIYSLNSKIIINLTIICMQII